MWVAVWLSALTQTLNDLSRLEVDERVLFPAVPYALDELVNLKR